MYSRSFRPVAGSPSTSSSGSSVAQAANFFIARNEWKLYIAELQYGSFGYTDESTWTLLQGRFIMAMFFEYAATLGLIDIAYIRAATGAK